MPLQVLTPDERLVADGTDVGPLAGLPRACQRPTTRNPGEGAGRPPAPSHVPLARGAPLRAARRARSGRGRDAAPQRDLYIRKLQNRRLQTEGSRNRNRLRYDKLLADTTLPRTY